VSVSSGPSGRGARVLVVAKAPEPGRVKTRLVPLLGEQGAAALCRAMLLDTLETSRLEVADVGVLYARAEERDALAALAGPDALLVLQQGEGHACALRTGMRVTLAEWDSALLVASDLPGVPPGSLRRALSALEMGADVVLGPSHDGGYWLVGMREPHMEPFERIPWSTRTVLEVTLDRCRAAGLEVALADTWRDVDTPEDLAAIADVAIPGPRTRGLVAQHSHASAALAPSVPRAAIGEERS
jgi:uncharacterized protein